MADHEPESAGLSFFEVGRRYVGNTVNYLGRQFDTFFSQDHADIENKSYLLLRVARVYEEQGVQFRRQDLKFKFDFPKTKDRLQLVFESDSDDFESLEEQQQDLATDEQHLSDADEDSTGALRYILDEWGEWKSSFDLGIKTSDPPETFIRYRLRRYVDLPDAWWLRFRNNFYYYEREGYGQSSKLYFERYMGESWLFSQLTEVRWEDEEADLEYALISRFIHNYSDRDTLTYSFGGFYNDHPHSHLTSYFVDFKYRRRLYKDWLFAEVIPRAIWSREDHFNDTTGITFRLEMYFRPK